VRIIGHAGARGLAPANTTAAFKKALEHNVDAIEFDVRVTKDNVPILNHDPVLSNASGTRLLIVDHTLAELRKCSPNLATLEGAIRIIDHAVPLHIEIKPGVCSQPIMSIIQQFLDRGWSEQEFSFASFDQRLLLAFHNAFPKCPTIVLDSWSKSRATKRAEQLGTRFIAMNQRWLRKSAIRGMTRRGYLLSAYTVNTPHQARRWEKIGLDGIVTDFPDRFESSAKV
jgi:glycerophosphoryl diester phosphodiesterase